MITVYTKNNCQPCRMTKHRLAGREDIIFKNIEEDPQAYEEALATGYKQMPIVVTPHDSWSGFNPTKLDTI